MLKYLVIQLDDTSPSFCHYANDRSERRLIALDALKSGLLWAMKENLMVQIVYPDYTLPKGYLELIDTVDHIDVEKDNADADVSIFEGIESLPKLKSKEYPHVVLRLTKDELVENVDDIGEVLGCQPSLNIVITDVPSFRERDFEDYNAVLEKLSDAVVDKMKSNRPVRTNLLTDRLLFSSMNNCNAGDESITLAPDGNFYICPAFYFEGDPHVGNPATGLSIPNRQLYRLEKAPICRICDAYQCKRCVWLNRKATYEVNTPGHEQCVVAHLERNASKRLLEKMKENGLIKTDLVIPEIDYLDPFDNVRR